VLIQWIGDVLSPPRCAACELAVSRDRVFCAPCATSVERRSPSSVSANPVGIAPDGELASVDVAFGYYGGALATAIRRLKYEDRPYLARPLGELLRGACRAAGIGADAVVPVPLHPHRLVERGYNQSALLAAHAARELHAPLVTTALARRIDTAPQVKLSGTERHANLAAAMVVVSPAAVRGRVLVVVDDVSTTGATLSACRNALFAAGAQRVIGVVLACSPSTSRSIPLPLDAEAVLDVGEVRVRVSSGCASVPLRANLRN
jgi:ComF family protein